MCSVQRRTESSDTHLALAVVYTHNKSNVDMPTRVYRFGNYLAGPNAEMMATAGVPAEDATEATQLVRSGDHRRAWERAREERQTAAGKFIKSPQVQRLLRRTEEAACKASENANSRGKTVGNSQTNKRLLSVEKNKGKRTTTRIKAGCPHN